MTREGDVITIVVAPGVDPIPLAAQYLPSTQHALMPISWQQLPNGQIQYTFQVIKIRNGWPPTYAAQVAAGLVKPPKR